MVLILLIRYEQCEFATEASFITLLPFVSCVFLAVEKVVEQTVKNFNTVKAAKWKATNYQKIVSKAENEASKSLERKGRGLQYPKECMALNGTIILFV